jgi:hypothetical protein
VSSRAFAAPEPPILWVAEANAKHAERIQPDRLKYEMRLFALAKQRHVQLGDHQPKTRHMIRRPDTFVGLS